MKGIIIILLFLAYPAFCQTIYQSHEVEKVAEPNGGAGLLNQFLVSNVQVPFKSTIRGVKGKVYVKGIVETDGTITGLEIVRGIDSLCNSEAIRVLALYKSWQPALLKNQKVRQSIVYPVTFIAPPRQGFDSTQSNLIGYYNDQYITENNVAAYKYRSVMPVNEDGNIKGDILFEELKNKNWKQIFTVPFQRTELWYKVSDEPGIDSVNCYQLSAQDDVRQIHYVPVSTFQTNGKLLAYTEYGAQGKPTLKKDYYLSGVLKEMKVFGDSSSTDIRYYANGQIKSIVENPVNAIEHTNEKNIINIWDADGRQYVKDGNGWGKLVKKQYTGQILVEEGQVASGVRDGKWTGKKADSTLFYEEIYEKGILKEGVAFVNGEKVNYQEKIRQPNFKGGEKAFYSFIGQNIKYPPNAARDGIKGRVFLSFVVCEDGSLCDYKILKGVRSDLDREALRVVQKMSGKWEAGELRGQKVRVKYNLPINFQF